MPRPRPQAPDQGTQAGVRPRLVVAAVEAHAKSRGQPLPVFR